MTTSASPHLFWITSRAAGIVALVAASLAVSLGLLMSTKLLRRRAPDLLAVHEVAVAVGAGRDRRFTERPCWAISSCTRLVADIAIPFVSSYKTLWTSLGIIAGWGLAALGLSYYLRRYIGSARWRKLHRYTALLWLFGLAHSVGEGTDAGQLWFLALIGIVVVPALALLATRWLSTGGPQAQPPRATRGDVRSVPARAVETAGPSPSAPSAPPDSRPERAALQARRVADHEARDSPPPCAQRLPVSDSATVSKRHPATSIQTWPALA